MALLLAGASALLFVSLGVAPLERAEIYFLDAARGMVESGDYLVPRFQGEPFFDKPPLTYWLMAAAFRLRGFSLEAARLVPAGAALGCLLATVWLGTLLFDRGSALAAAIIQATTLLFMSFGRVAMSDMLLTLWSTIAVALGVAIVRRGWNTPVPWALLGAVLGLGFLTKGPVALLLPGLALALLGVKERPARLPRGLLIAAAAFVVTGLGWFVLLYARLGTSPLTYFFLRENLERFAGETYDSGRSPLYYVGAYLAVGLPWSLILPIAAVRIPARERFLLVWMALMAIPLSLSRGKIDYYLLPLLPAASLCIARYLVTVPWGPRDRLWARGVLLTFVAAVLSLLVVEGQLPVEWLPGPGPRLALIAVVTGAAAAAGWAAWRPTPSRILAVLAGSAGGVFLVLAAFFLPAFRAAQPNADVLADVSRELRYRPDAALALCADPARVRRDVLFQARLAAQDRCDLWSAASAPQPYLLLLQPEEEASLSTAPRLREIARYRCLPATALTLGGLIQGVTPKTVILAANFQTDDPVAESKRKKDRKRALAEAEAAP